MMYRDELRHLFFQMDEEPPPACGIDRAAGHQFANGHLLSSVPGPRTFNQDYYVEHDSYGADD
jgi:hypothetical protein